jgi:glyoxylase-like metal-dependent hydrolase (beta-lactamase superfamily II)
MASSPGPWSTVAEGVRVRQSRAYAMNTTVLLDREHAVLVDPGVLPSELDDLAREVAALGAARITLVFTHAHWDHVLGRPWWPDARTVAHDRFAAEVKRDAARIRAEAEACAGAHGEAWAKPFEPFAPDDPVAGLHFHPLRPWRLVFRDAFGHCASQLSVHLPEARVLIAADMLSDLEIPLLDGPPEAYLRTLEALRPLLDGGALEVLIPGHGGVVHGAGAARERLERDLDYLRTLASRARAARAAGRTEDEAVADLDAMDFVGKRAPGTMIEEHRRNARHAFRSAGAPPGAARGRGPGAAAAGPQARRPARGRSRR